MATLNTVEARTTILSLPPEIIDLIANELHWGNESRKSDMRSCSLACKALLSSFQPLLFSFVYVHEGNLERFSNLSVENPKLCGYVRRAMFRFERLKKDMAQTFCAVAYRLTHLLCFDLYTGNSNVQMWERLNRFFCKGLRSILTSPTLTYIQLYGNIIFVVPPRLLFSSPAVKGITLCPVDETFRDIDHWAKLDAADVAAFSEAEESIPNPPTRCTTLCFSPHTGTRDESNWLPYVVSTHAKHLLHVSDLTVHGVSPCQMRSLQTMLYSLRSKLRKLDVHLCLPENPSLDLSRNRGLQSLGLSYEAHFPHNGLSVIQETLSGLNAPFLCKIALDLIWDCPGPAPQKANFPQPYLRNLDACFARVSSRHSHLRLLEFSMTFAHCPSEDPECEVWNEFYEDDKVESLRQRHFPFLCYDRPEKLRVWFREYLKVLGPRPGGA